MSDLGGSGISRASVHYPHWGVPEATGFLIDGAPGLTPGAPAVLTVGDLAMPGTIRTIGPFGGTTGFSWVGGAGGWDGPVQARAYGDPQGNRRSRVLADLAGEVGETRYGALVLDADGSIGPTWARPAGFARDAIDALSPHNASAPNIGGQWWVDPPSGVTHVGPRIATATTPQTMSVERYDPGTQRARVLLSDDAITQLLPGAVVTAAWVDDAPASTFAVGSMSVTVDADAIVVDLFGQKGEAELLADLIAALTAYTRWHACYPMQVASVSGSLTNVDPLNALAAALGGMPALPQWPGVPGLTATLAKGAPVGVSFLGGSPGGAAITSYGPGVNPASLSFQAGALALNGPTSIGGPVGSGAPIVYDLGGLLMTWIGSVTSALGLLGHPVTPPSAIASATGKVVP